jgi:hypothetical protein
VKIQIMGGKVCFMYYGLPQVNFPANNFNFH